MADSTPPSDRRAPYSAKRTRQACENCRRKKSRCPGEQPICSTCARLRQRCVYLDKRQMRHQTHEGSGSPSRTIDQHARRQLSAVEEKLNQVMAALEQQNTASRRDQPTISDTFSSSMDSPHAARVPQFLDTPDVERGSRAPEIPLSPPNRFSSTGQIFITPGRAIPEYLLAEGVSLYFRHFQNQPFPLFSRRADQGRICGPSFPQIVLYPMLALSLRTSKNAFFHNPKTMAEVLDLLSAAAWDLLSQAYNVFDIDLRYFQGLCLLAQVDFASGNIPRSQAQIALGLRLAQSRGMLSAHASDVTRPRSSSDGDRIVWTLFMMDRMLVGGHVSSPSVPLSGFLLPRLEAEPFSEIELNDSQRLKLRTLWEGGPLQEHRSVIAANIELVRLWEMVIADIASVIAMKSPLFWKDGSSWTKLQAALIDLELICIHTHRYSAVRSLRHEPYLQSYFAPWLFLQILYSAIHCCLHHPFLIFMRTRQLSGLVPLTLLQRTQENAMIHSQWVLRHMSEMEESGQSLQDPFVGYLVAIAATIQLEFTISKHPKVAAKAVRNVEKARVFLQKMSREWPNMLNTLNLVEEFQLRLKQRQTVNYVQGRYDGAVPLENVQEVDMEQDGIDLMWKLFNYGALSESHDAYYPSGTRETSTTHQERPTSTWNHVASPDISASNGVPIMSNQMVEGDGAVDDVFAGQLDDFDFAQPFTDDWSLFGRPWSAYFPDEPR